MLGSNTVVVRIMRNEAHFQSPRSSSKNSPPWLFSWVWAFILTCMLSVAHLLKVFLYIGLLLVISFHNLHKLLFHRRNRHIWFAKATKVPWDSFWTALSFCRQFELHWKFNSCLIETILALHRGAENSTYLPKSGVILYLDKKVLESQNNFDFICSQLKNHLTTLFSTSVVFIAIILFRVRFSLGKIREASDTAPGCCFCLGLGWLAWRLCICYCLTRCTCTVPQNWFLSSSPEHTSQNVIQIICVTKASRCRWVVAVCGKSASDPGQLLPHLRSLRQGKSR